MSHLPSSHLVRVPSVCSVPGPVEHSLLGPVASPDPGDTGPCLGTSVVVTLGCSWHRAGGARGAAQPPTVPRTAPQRRPAPVLRGWLQGHRRDSDDGTGPQCDRRARGSPRTGAQPARPPFAARAPAQVRVHLFTSASSHRAEARVQEGIQPGDRHKQPHKPEDWGSSWPPSALGGRPSLPATGLGVCEPQSLTRPPKPPPSAGSPCHVRATRSV